MDLCDSVLLFGHIVCSLRLLCSRDIDVAQLGCLVVRLL